MLVLTVATSRQFEIYLKDGAHIKLEVADHRLQDFYDGIRAHTPYAHFGYSEEIAKIYRKERPQFIDRLKGLGYYATINDYDL